MSRHVHPVDMVRVLTFAAVIAVHTVAVVNSPYDVPAGGALMLLHFTREAFFVLTAFVLVHRYRTDELAAAGFWRRRFLLVGVPYVVWSIVYTAVSWTFAPLPPAAAALRLLTNLLTGTAWFHLYFLLVSMQFYLIFPLVLRLLRATRGRHGRLLAASAVLQLGIDALLHGAHPGGLAGTLVPYAGSFVGSYPFYLLLGGVVALHRARVDAWVRGHPAAVVLALLGTGVAAEAAYLADVGDGVPPWLADDVFAPVLLPLSVAVVAAFSALGLAWEARRRDGPASRALQACSDRSFGVFLAHPLVIWLVAQAGPAWLGYPLPPAPASTIAVYVVVVAVSLVVVEALRHTPLSLSLTGKRGASRGSHRALSNAGYSAQV